MKRVIYLKVSVAMLSIMSFTEVLTKTPDDSYFNERIAEIEKNLNTHVNKIKESSEAFKNKLFGKEQRVDKVDYLKESLKELRAHIFEYNIAEKKLEELNDSEQWEKIGWNTPPYYVIRELKEIEEKYSFGSFFLGDNDSSSITTINSSSGLVDKMKDIISKYTSMIRRYDGTDHMEVEEKFVKKISKLEEDILEKASPVKQLLERKRIAKFAAKVYKLFLQLDSYWDDLLMLRYKYMKSKSKNKKNIGKKIEDLLHQIKNNKAIYFIGIFYVLIDE